MKYGIFLRLFFVFLLTMILTAAVLGFTGSHLYRGFFIKERQDVLLEQGRTIATLVAGHMKSQADIQAIIRLGSSPRTAVFIYGPDGILVAQTPHVSGDAQQNDLVQRVLDEGKEQVENTEEPVGDVQDIAIPVKRDGQVLGAVLVQGMGLERHFGDVYRLLIDSGVTAVIVSSVVAFFFSGSIARPLQEMSEIARRMAKGDFSKKVRVRRARDEIGELATAFNHMADELSTLEAMRREFVAHASHELRSPLTSIRGFVQAILDGTIPLESARPFLERIHRETGRLGNLVDDLLDLSVLENDEARDVEGGTAELRHVVREGVEALRGMIGEKGIRVRIEDGGELLVRGDEERLVQVVINLVSNSVRFSEADGEIVIRVSSGDHVGRVEVIDYGIGIPIGELDRVWERFYKVDRARTADSGGTGLGLPIAKRIVERYGGAIRLESVFGKGTTVTFDLPLVDR